MEKRSICHGLHWPEPGKNFNRTLSRSLEIQKTPKREKKSKVGEHAGCCRKSTKPGKEITGGLSEDQHKDLGVNNHFRESGHKAFYGVFFIWLAFLMLIYYDITFMRKIT